MRFLFVFEQVSSHDRGQRSPHNGEVVKSPARACACVRALTKKKMPVVCMMSQQTKTVRDKVCQTASSECSPPPARLAHWKPEVAEIRQ